MCSAVADCDKKKTMRAAREEEVETDEDGGEGEARVSEGEIKRTSRRDRG